MVIAMIGPMSSRAPMSAASIRDLPWRTCRSTFSTTTIASSTTRPTDSTIARMVSRFKLKPSANMTIAAPMSETGIATSGTSAVRIEPMNRNTAKPTISDRLAERLGDLFQGVPHEHRPVPHEAHLDVLRQRGPQALHRLAQAVRDLDLVHAGHRPHAEVDALVLVVLRDQVGFLGAELNARHVAQAHDGAPALRDDQACELVRRSAGPCSPAG